MSRAVVTTIAFASGNNIAVAVDLGISEQLQATIGMRASNLACIINRIHGMVNIVVVTIL